MKRLKIVEKTSPKLQTAPQIFAKMNVSHHQPGMVYEGNISLGH